MRIHLTQDLRQALVSRLTLADVLRRNGLSLDDPLTPLLQGCGDAHRALRECPHALPERPQGAFEGVLKGYCLTKVRPRRNRGGAQIGRRDALKSPGLDVRVLTRTPLRFDGARISLLGGRRWRRDPWRWRRWWRRWRRRRGSLLLDRLRGE